MAKPHRTNCMVARELLIALLATSAIVFAGCGGPGRISVSGRVTYQRGEWPKAGVIYFNPIEPAEGYPRLTGIGKFETDGSFTVQATGQSKGLVPGKYAVKVECYEVEPTMQNPAGKSYIPDGFTFPEVVIEKGKRADNIELNVP